MNNLATGIAVGMTLNSNNSPKLSEISALELWCVLFFTIYLTVLVLRFADRGIDRGRDIIYHIVWALLSPFIFLRWFIKNF